jgi:Rps23 Pro-64 3,4-dihydroxylase Tpa1-like proline 4-hydroxylase
MDGTLSPDLALIRPLVSPAPMSLGGSTASHVTLLMRDGSRLNIELADPLRQARDLTACLAPRTATGQVLEIELEDRSTLLLSAADILGVRLPPPGATGQARLVPAKPTPVVQPGQASSSVVQPRQVPATIAVSQDAAEVFTMGTRRMMRVRNFLPNETHAALLDYVLQQERKFAGSSVLSNDPEYRKSTVLYDFPEYQQMFRMALRAANPQICEAIGVPSFTIDHIECQLTATMDKGYFKPHNDNSAGVGHRKVTFVYYFHREPRPYNGGEIRFFGYNPLAPDTGDARHMLELLPVQNSIIFFDASCYHEVRDVLCQTPGFANARFTVNGWICTAKAQRDARPTAA